MIGLITFHCSYNYGAALQTYALQTKLQELSQKNGDTGGCTILNYHYTKDMKGYNIRWGDGLKRLLSICLLSLNATGVKLHIKDFTELFLIRRSRPVIGVN